MAVRPSTAALSATCLNVVLAVLALALLAGCDPNGYAPMKFEFKSCTNNARAVRFILHRHILSLSLVSGSDNVVPKQMFVAPVNLDEWQVTVELTNVAQGEVVRLDLLTDSPFSSPVSAAVTNVEFFTVPPSQIAGPGCESAGSPTITLASDPPLGGVVMALSNTGGQPLTLTSLELAESPNVFPMAKLDWADPDLVALPWQSEVNGPLTLDPAGPPLEVLLPATTTPGTSVLLCRVVSSEHGIPFRGISELELTAGVTHSKTATWGSLKATFRGRR